MVFNFIHHENGRNKLISIEGFDDLYRYYSDFCDANGLPRPKPVQTVTCRYIVKELEARGFVYIPAKDEYDHEEEKKKQKKKLGHPIPPKTEEPATEETK